MGVSGWEKGDRKQKEKNSRNREVRVLIGINRVNILILFRKCHFYPQGGRVEAKGNVGKSRQENFANVEYRLGIECFLPLPTLLRYN